jgi:hypothetical protein
MSTWSKGWGYKRERDIWLSVSPGSAKANLGVVWTDFSALSSAVLLWHGIYEHARD